ncbi:hypothetical protein ABZW18_32565 [Streptomyces sp. NPDC004647]|uniref:hypothetical protein n=1 Tax=Streptomyces sp. NPDC004647 TaxID=3154671 RepID=UPI0033BD1D5B
MSADAHVPVRAPHPRPVRIRSRLSLRVLSALRRAAPALTLYAAARLTGMAFLALWSRHAGKHPRNLIGFSWDSVWYSRVVAHGYGTVVHSDDPARLYSDLAFFPLYPAAVRIARSVFSLGFVNAGLLVSWTAAAAAAWGIYAVGERLHGRRAATLLVVLWGVLPHAVIQSMAYTESLLTALAAWSLYAVLTGRWLWAGSLSVFAGLSRPNGVAVAAAVSLAAAWQIVQLWRHRTPDSLSLSARQDWRLWAGAVLAPLGWLGYVLWVGWQKGNPVFGYFRVQRKWGSEYDFGRDAWESVRSLVLGQAHLTYSMVVAVAALAVLLFVLLVLDRPPLALIVYSGVLLVIALGGAQYFTSKPRFLLPAFPLLLPVAVGMARARLRTVAVTIGALAGLSCCYGTYLLAIATSAP